MNDTSTNGECSLDCQIYSLCVCVGVGVWVWVCGCVGVRERERERDVNLIRDFVCSKT